MAHPQFRALQDYSHSNHQSYCQVPQMRGSSCMWLSPPQNHKDVIIPVVCSVHLCCSPTHYQVRHSAGSQVQPVTNMAHRIQGSALPTPQCYCKGCDWGAAGGKGAQGRVWELPNLYTAPTPVPEPGCSTLPAHWCVPYPGSSTVQRFSLSFIS